MAAGFKERLRDARVAAGVDSSEDLARRTGLPMAIVQGWLDSDGESMLVRHALTLRPILHVRGDWLVTGNEPMLSRRKQIPEEREAVDILMTIPRKKVRFWFGMGRRLAK